MGFLWQKGIEAPAFAPLRGDLSTEVLVIGGGMAGVLCAKLLTQAGIECALVEAHKLGCGITRGTTAVVSAQHDILYQDIVRKYGTDCARKYLQANLQGLSQLCAFAGEVACELERIPTYVYAARDASRLKTEAALLQTLGFAAEFTRKTPLPYAVAGAVKFPDMAQFHPLKFLYGVANGLQIYENTAVQTLRGTTAVTAVGSIRAKKVIVATHFPFVNRRGLYFVKQFQRRSYVIAYQNAPQLGCAIEDGGENGVYLRNYRELLLIGGGDHRTGKRGGGYAAVDAYAKAHFPGVREVLRWSNQDCVTLDGLPYIGVYSPAMPDVLTATGFGLWGMTTSMAAAQILCDTVRGKQNPYAAAFAPHRSMLHPQLFKNLGETLVNFAIPTARRCTHLGCALRWNPLEHSWDCPCHGSRFTENGEVQDNPANRSL